ncbi:MAG: hypothetical protein LAQ69_29190 [Acidobacteriia bacterium]|nr:hypothetical protein [Terriglobia bacterium]
MVHVFSSLRASTQPIQVTTRKPSLTAKDTSADSGAADFRALFTNKTPATATPGNPPAPSPAPTAESVFGPNPWITNPTGVGPNGLTYSYNPYYFATPQTAAKVAQMVGGTVIQSNQFTPTGGAFFQQQPNQMVQLPDGRIINPGLVASFYNHGYSQSYIDTMIANEIRST